MHEDHGGAELCACRKISSSNQAAISLVHSRLEREVTCPNGKVSGNWYEIPSMAPYTVVRFGKCRCGPCPEQASCTSGEARTVNFLPQRLHEAQESGSPGSADRYSARPPGVISNGGTWPAVLQCSLQAGPAGSMRARLVVVTGLSVMASRVRSSWARTALGGVRKWNSKARSMLRVEAMAAAA